MDDNHLPYVHFMDVNNILSELSNPYQQYKVLFCTQHGYEQHTKYCCTKEINDTAAPYVSIPNALQHGMYITYLCSLHRAAQTKLSELSMSLFCKKQHMILVA